MCGIAGLVRFHGEGDDASTVGRMLDQLAHRGPDDHGLLTGGPVVLGHRRLSILDLSAAGHQPMADPSGRYVVVFNGEIYNYRDVQAELGIAQEALRSRSDTEILLHAWARWGPGALDHFAGQWAFALLDRSEGTLWLARDRFGEKPLFYHVDSERLTFASSIEALFADAQTPRALDGAALVEYLTLRYVLAPRTVVEDVKKLPGGSLLRIAPDGTREERAWYRPHYRPRGSTSAKAAEERAREFDDRFARACERCLVSDVPVGLLLSDGIDSHSIHTALRARGHDVRPYTFRLSGGSIVSDAIPGADAESIELTPQEYVGGIEQMCGRLTEPVGDLAALATAAIIERARTQATVFLCGHGGDEILGGYRLSQDRFRLAALHQAGRLPLGFVQRGLARHLFGDQPLESRIRGFLEAPSRFAPTAARYLMQRPVATGDLKGLFGGPWPASEHYLAGVDRLYAECDDDATDLARMQEVMIRTFLCEDILPFADSSAMAASAELRMPYLDRDLVDLVLSMPDRERVGGIPGRTNTKLPLRRWAEHRLPRAVTRQRKRPFAAGDLGQMLRDPAFARAQILGANAVRRALPGVESWLSARMIDWPARADGVVWSLITLGAWSRKVGAD